MQWPPMPGPGKKGIKPKGFVAAARTTSHVSMPRVLQSLAISFAMPMLIARKVFSQSLQASATRAEETA